MAYLGNTIVNGLLRAINGIYASGDCNISGTLTLSKDTDTAGAANNKPALIVGGTDTTAHIEIDGNEIMAKSSSTATGPLYLNNDGGNVYVNNKLVSLDGHIHSYLPLTGGTITGTLNYNTENNIAWNYRPGHSGYYCTASYQTSGNEALVFASKNSVTSFMFINGEDSITNHAASRWTELTPGLQIKQNNVSIGRLIPNGTTASYKLDVNGATNISGDLTVTSINGVTVGTPKFTDTTYSANNGVGLSGTTFYNSGVRSIATGSTNGTISVNTNGTAVNVAVKGLGSAAYVNLSAIHKHGHAYPGGGSVPWHLVSRYIGSDANQQINTGISFYVSEFHSAISYGILNVRVRFESNGTSPGYLTATWSLACNIDPNNFIMTYKVDESHNVEIKLYCKRTGWSSYAFNKIEEQSWGSEQDLWETLVSNNSTAYSVIPEDETQIVSTIGTLNNSISGSSTKLGASTIGGTTTPIYLNAGTPAACSYTIAKSVPANAVFTDTTYTGANGISLSGTTFSNSGVRSIATGGTNGTISVNTNGTAADVAVKGLASGAYAAAYVHPTSAGNIHLPSGGASGNFLKWSSAGTGKWESLTKAEITTALGYTPPTTNTTYSAGHSMTLYNGAFDCGKRWNAVTQGQKWSRIMLVTPAVTMEGTSGILSVSCIRGSVVCNASFYITSSHAGSNLVIINQISANSYSPFGIRGVGSTNGTYYLELLDTANNIASGTAQTWHCTYIPILNSTVTIYTAFTDGTTIPSGYAAYGQVTTVTNSNALPIRNISRSGTTFTATRTDGSTFTFTQQDSDTKYSAATQSAAGLMSAADKKKLDGIATGANNYTYTLPTATSSVLGGVKTGSNITNSSGTISLTKANVTAALGYTPPTTNTTYSTGTASVSGLTKLYTGTGTNTDGTMTQSAIKTALDGKAASSHGNHVPATQTANNAVFLRNDNTWQTVTPANIGAAASGHNHDSAYLKLTGGTVTGNVTLNGTNGTNYLQLPSGIKLY